MHCAHSMGREFHLHVKAHALNKFHVYCITFFLRLWTCTCSQLLLDGTDFEATNVLNVMFLKVCVLHDLKKIWEPWGAGPLNKLLLENEQWHDQCKHIRNFVQAVAYSNALPGGRDNLREVCHDQQCGN